MHHSPQNTHFSDASSYGSSLIKMKSQLQTIYIPRSRWFRWNWRLSLGLVLFLHLGVMQSEQYVTSTLAGIGVKTCDTDITCCLYHRARWLLCTYSSNNNNNNKNSESLNNTINSHCGANHFQCGRYVGQVCMLLESWPHLSVWFWT